MLKGFHNVKEDREESVWEQLMVFVVNKDD